MVSQSVPIGVGVGVGVPLALISCTFGALFLRERRKRVQAEQTAASNGYYRVAGEEKPPSPIEMGQNEQAPELDSRPVEGPPKPANDQYA